MFRSIETTGVIFTRKTKIKTRKPLAVRRPDTPRPTEEDVLTIMAGELTVMPTICEPEAKKPKNTTT